MQELTITRPDDFHVHLREHGNLHYTLEHTAKVFGRALVMPNLQCPVLTGQDAARYRGQILEYAGKKGCPSFLPLMTIQIVDATTPEIIRVAHEAAVTAGKLYPSGVTTNSENGVRRMDDLAPVFEEMQRVDMVLCLHGETPNVFSLDREHQFLKVLQNLCYAFPRLRIVLEHLSTGMAVRTIKMMPKTVAATITAHHLLLTLDDVIGDKLRPHNFCKPIPKREEDRLSLLSAATGGNPKFFFGSDSAPHLAHAKQCASGCAGVFTAPMAMPLLTTIFERHDALERLEAFVSLNGARFYGLPINGDTIRLLREDWQVPVSVPLDYIPFMAGETLPWKIAI
jgi:dihydroorotase